MPTGLLFSMKDEKEAKRAWHTLNRSISGGSKLIEQTLIHVFFCLFSSQFKE